MKESDYILASNLAKLRLGRVALSQVFGLTEDDGNRLHQAMILVTELISEAETEELKRFDAGGGE